MTKMESDGPYMHSWSAEHLSCDQYCPACAYAEGRKAKLLRIAYVDDLKAEILRRAYAEGRKEERERNWKTVVGLCGVNPAERRPCIEKVDRKFWCPVCLCADSIRGGQDGQ